MSQHGLLSKVSRSPNGDEPISTGGAFTGIRPESGYGSGRQTARRSRVSVCGGRQTARRSRRFTPGEWISRLSICPDLAQVPGVLEVPVVDEDPDVVVDPDVVSQNPDSRR
ncbi:uncharacterized protein LOC135171236 [Diachasmimorpha longicaudata]|uniref:uncharacterized protein LOC135171236 n=1 Tax=Diachasmimorpha longicaudata TaxID=58733 RepID=UPI0030B89A42